VSDGPSINCLRTLLPSVLSFINSWLVIKPMSQTRSRLLEVVTTVGQLLKISLRLESDEFSVS
jgi:predicted small integral membrane protein